MDNQELKFSQKRVFVVFSTVAILVLLLFSVWLGVDVKNKIEEGKYIGQEIKARNTITVSGTGEIYARPDLAQVSFWVIAEAKTVEEAMSKNSEKMNAVIDFIKGKGIEEKDIKTTSFNLYPRYEYHKTSEIYPPEGKRVLVGYEVRQSLEVKIRDFSKIGEIIQGAIEKGANQVGDLQFTIDKEDELKKQARTQAIKKAKEKAKELASQLGISLGKITNFSESAVYPRPYFLEKASTGMGGGETPQIEPGENKIEVTVSITYEIR
jgi:hypothetical protein